MSKFYEKCQNSSNAKPIDNTDCFTTVPICDCKQSRFVRMSDLRLCLVNIGTLDSQLQGCGFILQNVALCRKNTDDFVYQKSIFIKSVLTVSWNPKSTEENYPLNSEHTIIYDTISHTFLVTNIEFSIFFNLDLLRKWPSKYSAIIPNRVFRN